MLTLILAAALMGPPAPQSHPPTPPEPIVSVALADRMADHAWWIGMGAAADLGSTGWALAKCPSCYEANPFGANVESRLALKLAGGTAVLGTIWKLEKDGHSKSAKILRWIYVGMATGLTVNNSIHAIRGR